MPYTLQPTPNTLDVKIINPIEYPGWDNLLLQHEDATIFHTSTWSKTLCESYKYKPKYFATFNKGKISATIPIIEVNSPLTGKRGVSLPFTDYCEPLLDKEIGFKEIFTQIIAYGKKKGWKYIELRGGDNFLNDVTPSTYYFGHILNLSKNEKEIFKNFRKSTQRNIKKAAKEEVLIQFSHSLESIKEFYRLNSMTRKEHGLPAQPLKFFKKVHKEIISRRSGHIVLAIHNNKAIAGAVYFHHGEKALYKYGASDRNHQHLRANNLIMWEAIEWYCRNGYKTFCFGRTEPENQGLRQFKSGWRTQEHLIKYYKYDLQKDTFVKEKQTVKPIHNKIFSNMPIPVLKAIGALLYKHMG